MHRLLLASIAISVLAVSAARADDNPYHPSPASVASPINPALYCSKVPAIGTCAQELPVTSHGDQATFKTEVPHTPPKCTHEPKTPA